MATPDFAAGQTVRYIGAHRPQDGLPQGALLRITRRWNAGSMYGLDFCTIERLDGSLVKTLCFDTLRWSRDTVLPIRALALEV
jgi:hypothetical protein